MLPIGGSVWPWLGTMVVPLLRAEDMRAGCYAREMAEERVDRVGGLRKLRHKIDGLLWVSGAPPYP